MDRECFQYCADVHRPVYRLSRRFARCPPRTPDCRELFHASLSPLAADTQLQVASDCLGVRGADLRNLLSADTQLRAPKYSAAIPSIHARAVRDICRRSRQHCPLPLRLVSRPFLLPLDVLEFRTAHTAYARMHFLWNSRCPGREEARGRAKLRRFSLCQCRICNVVRRARSGPETGLVALRSLQRTVSWCIDFLAGCASSTAARSEPAGGPAVPPAVEHLPSGSRLGIFPFLPPFHDRPSTAVAFDPRF